MKIGVLGTGMVGTTIGTKLVQLGHDVMMGSRTRTNEKAAAWVKANGPKASHGTFANAARFGETLFNCTSGIASVDALKMAGAANLNGKVLLTSPTRWTSAEECPRRCRCATPIRWASRSNTRFRT